ncbi:hypothetical protein AALA36_18240 [Lachnospiraceae bacterium 66-29]
MKKTDYTGKKVGWLTVLKELPKQKKNDVVWLCQCDCGKMINRTSAYTELPKRTGYCRAFGEGTPGIFRAEPPLCESTGSSKGFFRYDTKKT